METALQDLSSKVNLPEMGTFDLNLGGLTFSPNYLQAGAILALLFLLVLTLARVRRLYIDWSFHGWYAWLFLGFVLALILEGFLIISGRTAVTGILGWKNAPQPILQTLDTGRNKLVNVLGVTEEIPSSYAEQPISSETVLEDFQTLDVDQAEAVRTIICKP